MPSDRVSSVSRDTTFVIAINSMPAQPAPTKVSSVAQKGSISSPVSFRHSSVRGKLVVCALDQIVVDRVDILDREAMDEVGHAARFLEPAQHNTDEALARFQRHVAQIRSRSTGD